MTELILTSAQQAALNAAGEALIDLGLKASISYDPNDAYPNTRFVFTARAKETNYLSGCAGTIAEAANKCLVLLNPEIAKARALEGAMGETKKLRLPSEVIAAVKDQAAALVGGDGGVDLNTLLEKIDALPVKD